MRIKFLLIVIISNTIESSWLDEVNDLLLYQDLNFIQTSINETATDSVVSTGNIRRISEVLIVDILTPYNEQYIINDSTVRIINKDFDQESEYEISKLPNNDLISIMRNGFSEGQIKKIDEDSYKIIGPSQLIMLKPISNNTFEIMYLDNLNILNTIKFTGENE